ncbi:CDP-diacylglycerol--serine O-phosphatidyltransferase [Ferrovibrio sp.]|uniref:CDP-diacylglycerol--serine O-phosphatidyltransferase n=1 Tax=Ferrovibrio sp. TaxID=1917215 RepID=UPI000CBD89EC|nr:CDP-diacylglycerol--serine O-phosphatidyltransferase [Ferrovibrio sp.]PJI43790.1 MAG: CDP-diacylglycerol--serine O-phosphatidyltransferase [Ferrovibrio sp.]
MKLKPPQRLGKLPLNTLAPNILTIIALCSGLTAIRFALLGQFKFAVLAIATAAFFDMLDGRVARLLKGASKFGAELDSLSDFLSFGVAPAMVLYFWTLHDLGAGGNTGWLVVLAFAVCAALRLARFNTALDDDSKPVWTGSFFTGVPAPAGAGLSLLFLIINLELESAFFASPFLNAVWMLCIGGLMISRVPTYSFKRVRVKREYVGLVLLGVGLLVAALLNQPWYTLAAMEIAYIASIPLSIKAHDRLKRGDAQAQTGDMADAAAASAAMPAAPAAGSDADGESKPGSTPGVLH